MASFADNFRTIKAGNAFFVGANTPRGFMSDHRRLLSEDEFKKVYIIKGGSGTGKSTMMRKAAAAAEGAGAVCTYLLCGSDPDSLDGVIMEKGGVRVGIMDGTAPHTMDPVYAGACGEIVNCGDCWNSAYLEERRTEISRAVKEKKLCFETAYRFLSGAGEVTEMQRETADRILLRGKMSACIDRLVSTLPAKGSGNISERRTVGITMKGAVRLDTFERAKRVITVEDCADLAPFFADELAARLAADGRETVISRFPTGGIAEIYIPSADTCVTLMNCEKEAYKNINMRRFADIDEIRNSRQRRRFLEKCLGAMLDGARESLESAAKLHFELEDIYKASMDFKGLDELGERLCRRVCNCF